MIDSQIMIISQLLLAAILGGAIGLEREIKKREAGLRTYSLVSLGAAFFSIISLEAFQDWTSRTGQVVDPTRIIAQVVLGIGFIGAGLIIFRQQHVEGVTTAAGLWVAAAIGVAVGVKFIVPAVFVTFLTISILSILRIVEERFFPGEK